MRTKKNYYPLSLIFLLPLFVACGDKSAETSIAIGVQPVRLDPASPTSGQSAGNPKMPSASEIQTFRNGAESGKLFCPFSDECNPSVVMISVVTDQGLERCSGVLISPTEVLTNDHCVEKNIAMNTWESRLENLPCRDFVFTHFSGADSNTAGPTIGCDSIEVRSGEAGIASIDYAVIKLSEPVTDRAPAPLSNRGFSDNEKAKIYRIQMTNEGFDGMQNKLECVASYKTFLYPAASTPDSTLMTFGDCAIQAGNSGSPVMNENGEVSAIIQGYLSVKPDTAIVKDLNDNLLDGSYGEVAIGTQVKCMPTINRTNNERVARARSCAPITSMGSVLASDYISMNGEFPHDILPVPPVNLRWLEIAKANPDSHKALFFAAPVCTNDQAVSGQEIEFQKGINHFMQVEWRAIASTKDQTVSFDLAAARGGDRVFINRDLGSLPISACTNVVAKK